MLARVVFLKQRQEYAQALLELDRALAKFLDVGPGEKPDLSLEEWIEQCRAEEGGLGQKLVALADLFNEQGDIHALQSAAKEAQRSDALALGLYLEALNGQLVPVSVDLLGKVENLIELLAEARLPAEVLQRLLRYYEARGRLAQAEDVLFDWLDTGDPTACEGGLAFYDRLAAWSDAELARGNLPRAEVEQGRQEVLGRMRDFKADSL